MKTYSSIPDFLRICGRETAWPKLSTFDPVRHSFPKVLRKYRWPYSPWRTNASPHGRMQSGSMNQPPARRKRPSSTRRRMRENSSGLVRSSHSKNAEDVAVKVISGSSSMRSRAEPNVALTSCIPSSQSQNQTGSMWELPVI